MHPSPWLAPAVQRRPLRPLLLSTLALSCALLVACSKEPQGPGQMPPPPVGVVSVAPASVPIEVELYSFEPTGAENLYVLRSGVCEVTTRTSTTESAHLGKTEGTRLTMRFDPSWIYLFDAETGQTVAQAAASGREARA